LTRDGVGAIAYIAARSKAVGPGALRADIAAFKFFGGELSVDEEFLYSAVVQSAERATARVEKRAVTKTDMSRLRRLLNEATEDKVVRGAAAATMAFFALLRASEVGNKLG
jgi:hypothetical protein